MPLPEPVELQLKNLPLDATEPALRSLFGQKGLTFDSVEFYVTAKMTVSSQAQAEKVIQGFHMYQIAGRSIECVQVKDPGSGSRPRSRRRERSRSAPRRDPRSPRPEIRRDRSRTPPRAGGGGGGGGRERSRSRQRRGDTFSDKGGGRGGGGGGCGGGRDDGRARGSVLRYDEEKGFGFIKPDRGSEDVFVHFSNLPREYQRNGTQVLQTGDRVIFDQEIDQKKGKPCAKNVQIEGGGGGGGGPGRGGGGYGGGGGGPGPGRSQGTVSNWDGEKGFGFIKPDSGDKDLFVHFSSLPRNYQRGGDSTLRQGDRVTFVEAFDDAKGKSCAKNVQVDGAGGGGMPPGGGMSPPGGKGKKGGDKGGDKGGCKGGGKSDGGGRGIMSAERRRQLFESCDESPSPPRRQPRPRSRSRSGGSRSPPRRRSANFSSDPASGFAEPPADGGAMDYRGPPEGGPGDGGNPGGYDGM